MLDPRLFVRLIVVRLLGRLFDRRLLGLVLLLFPCLLLPKTSKTFPRTSFGLGILNPTLLGGLFVLLLGEEEVPGAALKELAASARRLPPLLEPRKDESWSAKGRMSIPREFPPNISEQGIGRFLKKMKKVQSAIIFGDCEIYAIDHLS